MSAPESSTFFISSLRIEKSADSKNPKIYYNGRDTKIYILNGNSLFSSEKITP